MRTGYLNRYEVVFISVLHIKYSYYYQKVDRIGVDCFREPTNCMKHLPFKLMLTFDSDLLNTFLFACLYQ